MSEVVLNAQRRQPGRSGSRVLRRNSRIPGVYYFHGEEAIAISVAELDLRPLIYTKESRIVALKIDDGTEKTCILKDMSFDPMSDRPVHFDLLGVAADETVVVEVPVLVTGQAEGQRHGGLVQLILHKLEVECLPSAMPQHIEVDITNLQIGDAIHAGDIQVPNVTVVTPADATVVSIAQPRVETEVAAQTTAAEPEVIAKGKEKSED